MTPVIDRPRTLLLAAAAVVAVLSALVARSLAQRGETPPIVGPDRRPVPASVASLEQATLGGVPQWILVRGQDRAKPVLLFLHGGPGMPAMFLAHAWQRGLEQDFVVVHWDRRGTGKSARVPLPPGSLTVRRTLDDLLELVDTLRARFGHDRVYLVGHSWGSHLGLLAVREHPDRYLAFVGTGQLAGTSAAVREARRAWLAARQAAPAAERVTEDDVFRHGGELHGRTSFWPILAAGLRAPEYDLRDVLSLKGASDRVNRDLREDVEPRPLEGEVARVEVPVFFLLGRHDMNTPSALAAAYLERLDAPLKGQVWFEASAHFPFFEEPDRFRAAMRRVDAEVRAFWAARSGPR